MTQFQPGQVVYDKWGHRGEYVAEYESEHYVRPLIAIGGWDDEGDYAGEEEVWPHVYAKAPLPKVSLAVVAIVLVIVVGSWLTGGGAA